MIVSPDLEREDYYSPEKLFKLYKAWWSTDNDPLRPDIEDQSETLISDLPLIISISEDLQVNSKELNSLHKVYDHLEKPQFSINIQPPLVAFWQITWDQYKNGFQLIDLKSGGMVTPILSEAKDIINLIQNCASILKLVELTSQVQKASENFEITVDIIHSNNFVLSQKLHFNEGLTYYFNHRKPPKIRISIGIVESSAFEEAYLDAVVFNGGSTKAVAPSENLQRNMMKEQNHRRLYRNLKAYEQSVSLKKKGQSAVLLGLGAHNSLSDSLDLYTNNECAFIKIFLSRLPVKLNLFPTESGKSFFSGMDNPKAGASFLNNQIIFNIPIKLVDFEKWVRELYERRAVVVKDDIQKCRWGGKNAINGYQLTATVRYASLYRVTVQINSQNRSDSKNVALFVHQTFSKQIIFTNFNNGLVEIELNAYEAFTLGAYIEDGTELELDLQRTEGFPNNFYYPYKADILWVDDRPEMFNRGIIKVLEKKGFVFYEALDTEQAISLLANNSFDLIITDMVRGKNEHAGMDLLNHLKEKEIKIPTVVYSSNYAIDIFRDDALALGAIDVFSGSTANMVTYLQERFRNKL